MKRKCSQFSFDLNLWQKCYPRDVTTIGRVIINNEIAMSFYGMFCISKGVRAIIVFLNDRKRTLILSYFEFKSLLFDNVNR